MKDYIKIGIEKGLISFNDDMSRITYVHQKKERNYNNTLREIERLEGIVENQRKWNREKNIKTAESKLKVVRV